MHKLAECTLLILGVAMGARAETLRLESRAMTVHIDAKTGRWALHDRRTGARWPTDGLASAGAARALQGGFAEADATRPNSLRLTKKNGAAVVFSLVDRGRGLEVRYEGKDLGEVRVLGDALRITDTEGGYLVVPCREGLLIPADSGKSFRRTFGTSEYEGCHINALGFLKAGSVLAVTWDDAYTFPELSSARPRGKPAKQELTAEFRLRRSARSLRLWPMGKGDWNTLAAGYRRIAEQKKLASTLHEKIARNADAAGMIGAANVKLWTCLARRMNEASTKEKSVTVRWTFAEAAAIAAHLRNDLGIERCLFMMGGWTEGGYDCRHPDNLPANPECGGNEALSAAVRKIEKLGYVACLHDNVQDMYRDAKSFDLGFIEKRPDGSPITGGRWLGGRAYMVCAPKQLELAKRPQNLPAIHRLFNPKSYFIDTTFAVGPRECHDPNHPLGRNDDIAWKIKLSDYARETFGLFGSECGREWALPHSDFFEGLVAVSGRYYHQLKPDQLGAIPIPFWEMVYHDCQIAWGKYGYAAEKAAEYVAHHVFCARPLHYHSMGDHLYWKQPKARPGLVPARPHVTGILPAGKQAFRIRYAWDVDGDIGEDWRVFVHFGTPTEIQFQDDHAPDPPTSTWRKDTGLEIGPRTVRVPPALRGKTVNVYVGLFRPDDVGKRALLPGCDSQRRVLVAKLRLTPGFLLEPAGPKAVVPERLDYTCAKGGWAEGLHPTDAFLKNTHEVLGPLHATTAHMRLTKLEFLWPGRSLRRATYGTGADAVRTIVNFGDDDAEVTTDLGGRVVLGSMGFVVEGPRFAAFCAEQWGGTVYGEPTLFTLRSLDGKPLTDSGRVRVFHGFGPATIRWRGRSNSVAREKVLTPNGEGNAGQ